MHAENLNINLCDPRLNDSLARPDDPVGRGQVRAILPYSNYHPVPNNYFQFKQFLIRQDRCSMKVTTDACLFGAWVADDISSAKSTGHVLDIGAGTGLLSLMLAQQTTAAIDSIEIQQADYEQACENIDQSPWKDQITLLHADASVYAFEKKYGVIISNPPFYEADLKSAHTGKNIAHHDEGLHLVAMIDIICKQLLSNGIFYLLYPAKRFNDLQAVLTGAGLYLNTIVYVRQTPKHEPFRVMVSGSRSAGMYTESTIVIKDGAAYSASFAELLRPYYLYL